jgi:hypothetical protein
MHVICYADACAVQGTLSNKGQYVNLFNNCSTTLETLFVSFTWSWSDLIDECFPGPLQRGADDGWTDNHYRTLARLISRHAWLYTELVVAETIVQQKDSLVSLPILPFLGPVPLGLSVMVYLIFLSLTVIF